MNYSNTTTNKTFLMRTNTANANTSLSASLWRSTAAITSISLGVEFTQNFVVGSTFNLYGILGANA
jgi:hemolysin activation/secretion protein